MNIAQKNTNQRTPLYKRLIRFLLVSIIGLFFLLILSTIVLYVYKDRIASEILNTANQYQQGEILFSDITFNPFVQFPSISIQLNDVSFYENSNDSIKPNLKGGIDTIPLSRKSIAEIQYLYAAIDILALFRGDIDITKVMLSNGAINIIKYPDSTFNLTNAIMSTRVDIEIDTAQRDDEKNGASLLLDKVTLRNIQLVYFDSIESENNNVKINKLKASLEYLPELISANIDVELQLNEVGINKEIKIHNKSVALTSSMNYNRINEILDIEPSKLRIEETIFNFYGSIDFKEKGFIDLEIKGSDQNFGFSKLLLTETGINQIQKGDLYFNGTVKGDLAEGIPNLNFSFGLKDVDLYIPTVDSNIADINLDGKFTSGIKSDFSDAKLTAKNITAKLPGGHLEGSFEINNFKSPEFNLDWDMEAKVDGFEDIFNLSFVDSLAGHIKIKDHFVGHLDPELGWILDTASFSFLECKDLSFNLPGVMYVKNLSGNFSGGNDTLKLDSVSILTGNTDLLIDGEIYNMMSLFLKNDKNITSNLAIQSGVLDLPELLAYDPRVGENFPYQIVDIDLLVQATTSAEKLSNFYSNPEIDFEIQSLDATIQNFLPPVHISKGLFKLHEKEERVLLNFYDFDISMMGSEIKADVEYFSPQVLPDYVKTKATIQGLIPGKILYNESMDSIPSFLNGSLNGSLICDVTLGSDTNTLDRIFIDQGNLIYETANDTINIKSLFVEVEDIIYDLDKNPNPFATLTTKCFLKVDELSLGILEVTDVEYNIETQRGEYIITPNRINFFGEEGQGTYTLKPYNEIPSYEVTYWVEQFRVEELTRSFLEDTIITGKAELKLDLKMTGDKWDSIVSNINGNIYLSGTDLTLYGLDADKLIEKLKRSQNFNLVDVGAVILAGPVGLAVTKGSDFARIITSNPGEETFIPLLMSDWNIENGKLNIQDVAFSTDNNRIAAKGWIDFKTDSLNMTIAALNDRGCSIMSQDLYGEFANLEMGDVQVVKSLLAPVTNLVKGAFGVNCKVFYEGEVKHPIKQKKQ